MNIEEYEVSRKCSYMPFPFNDQTYYLNKDLYLDIVVTDFCNAKCKFCVADLVHSKQRCNIDISKQKIKFAIQDMGVQEVLILGGEATIDNKLFDIIEYLNRFNLRKICLTTNGHRLAKDIVYTQKLFSSGLTHINISLMSLDSDKQKEISQKDIYISLENLKNIYEIANINNIHIRINNNVFLGNNDTIEKIVNFYENIKNSCDSVKFSPLLKTDSFSTVNEVTEWNNQHILSPEKYDKLWYGVEEYFNDYPLIRNKETLGFVEYSMILLNTPLILNYNQHNKLKQKFEKQRKINSLKLLATGDLSFSWNRERRDLVLL